MSLSGWWWNRLRIYAQTNTKKKAVVKSEEIFYLWQWMIFAMKIFQSYSTDWVSIYQWSGKFFLLYIRSTTSISNIHIDLWIMHHKLNEIFARFQIERRINLRRRFQFTFLLSQFLHYLSFVLKAKFYLIKMIIMIF